jgi:hypothetical protein
MRLARARGAAAVERRALFTPRGEVLAIYYFARGGKTPLLRESDADGDGVPERWTSYERGARREVWEDRRGSGEPDTHLVYGPGGELERISLLGASGRGPQRVFHYEKGLLTREDQDTNGDGRLDRFERFDAAGDVVSREEDLTGDGKIDVRSTYSAGKLVRREFTDAALAEELMRR